MAYNRVNKLRMYKKIVALTNEHYDPDVMSSYAKIHRLYIYPIYPVSYSHYMKIISTSNLERLLEEEEKAHGKWEDPAQTELFPKGG